MNGIIIVAFALILTMGYSAYTEGKERKDFLKENCINNYILSDNGLTCYMKVEGEVFEVNNEMYFNRIEETIEIYNKLK